MRRTFQRWLPTEDKLKASRSLRWLGPLLHRPWLWHFNRRTVAAGVGIGIFFGFLIPVLQIAFSAIVAILLRANLPVAAISTLVSNPFTYAPIFYLAYRTGHFVLGNPLSPSELSALASGASQLAEAAGAGVATSFAWADLLAMGKPLFVGLAIFAVVGGVLGYFGTLLAWRGVTALKARRRRIRRSGNRLTQTS
jgi:uncharacterized protein (DUF2062 family)